MEPNTKNLELILTTSMNSKLEFEMQISK